MFHHQLMASSGNVGNGDTCVLMNLSLIRITYQANGCIYQSPYAIVLHYFVILYPVYALVPDATRAEFLHRIADAGWVCVKCKMYNGIYSLNFLCYKGM